MRAAKSEPLVIKLTADNTIILDGVVTSSSVAYVIKEMIKKDALLEKELPMYLYLNSPGGSVNAGIDLIMALPAFDREIITISKFAFSMAFSIAVRGDRKYILKYGTMGQHQASLGVQGYLSEVESRVQFIKEMMKLVNEEEAEIVGLSLEDFLDKIMIEWWSFGKKAVENKVADAVIEIVCEDSLKESKAKYFQPGFFGGSLEEEINACPLLR